MASLLLIDRLRKLVNIKLTEASTPQIIENQQLLAITNDNICEHNELELIDGRKTCSDCGVIVDEHFLVDNHLTSVKNRRQKPICPIYNEIPSYVSQDIKNLTVDIYKKVTEKKIFRNVFRRAVVMACLHRASIIKRSPIFFDDMLEMFNIKAHYANKGMSYVSNNLDNNSIYSIPYCDEEGGILSVLSSVGLKAAYPNVVKLFDLVKLKSDLLNNSQTKSVICGCAYFHARFINVPITLKQFSLRSLKAEMTITKKFIAIQCIVLKLCLKRVFSRMLIHSNVQTKSNNLYDPIEKITIINYKSPDLISVIGDEDDYIFPLDDVDDIYEWNFLLNKTYYTDKNKHIKLSCKIAETSKTVTISFKEYNDTYNINADLIVVDEINKLLGYNNISRSIS